MGTYPHGRRLFLKEFHTRDKPLLPKAIYPSVKRIVPSTV
jgi:hypothetical protein